MQAATHKICFHFLIGGQPTTEESCREVCRNASPGDVFMSKLKPERGAQQPTCFCLDLQIRKHVGFSLDDLKKGFIPC